MDADSAPRYTLIPTVDTAWYTSSAGEPFTFTGERFKRMPGAYSAEMEADGSEEVRYPPLTPERPILRETQSDLRPTYATGSSSRPSLSEARPRSAPQPTRAGFNRLPSEQTSGSPIKSRHRPARASHIRSRTSNASGEGASPRYIHDQLRTCVSAKVENKGTFGLVYVLRNMNNRNEVKIGSTQRCRFYKRKEEITRACNADWTVVYLSAELEHYMRAEDLVHKDLMHLGRRFECAGGCRLHTDRFEVQDEMVIATVRRWVDFIKNQQPYDTAGALKAVWVDRLNNNSFDQATNEVELHRQQYLRWDLWNEILQPPSSADYVSVAIQSVKEHSNSLVALENHLLRSFAIWNVFSPVSSIFYILGILCNTVLPLKVGSHRKSTRS